MAADSHLGVSNNSVLVLDEPETHLHPSGARFMKNELFQLANQGNQVFFATHSIFMIDRTNLERHIIVEKKHEYSQLKKVDRNTITQESVIYEAMGTKVDEFSIPMFNIMFEGELDRRLFSCFVTRCLKKADNPFGDYALFDGGGTKQIGKFFKDKVLPQGSKWMVILDKDSPGRNLAKTLNESYPDGGDVSISVTHYSDSDDDELEDILPVELVEESFNSALHQETERTETLTLGKKPVSSQIQEFYGRQCITGKDKDNIERVFKAILDIKVKEIISSIDKGKNIDDRKKAFIKAFGEYSKFIDSFIKA
jgi:predicted ATP-dependent endonuclease of OLD family